MGGERIDDDGWLPIIDHLSIRYFATDNWFTTSTPVNRRRFGNYKLREPIQVKAIQKDRWTLRCRYCTASGRPSRGTCVQCSEPRCFASFHVTCAYRAGLLCRLSDTVVQLFCSKHLQDDLVRITAPRSAKTFPSAFFLGWEWQSSDNSRRGHGSGQIFGVRVSNCFTGKQFFQNCLSLKIRLGKRCRHRIRHVLRRFIRRRVYQSQRSTCRRQGGRAGKRIALAIVL